MNYATDGEFHYDLLELLARRMKPRVYVELGIGKDTDCIRRVIWHCERAIGVDTCRPVIDYLIGYRTSLGNYAELHQMTTTDFIDGVLPLVGAVELAFIDADHSAEAALSDLLGLLPHVAQDGIIAMHDTYPADEGFTSPGLCGDCWKTADHLRGRTIELGIEVVTLPTPPGLTLIRKRTSHLRWKAAE